MKVLTLAVFLALLATGTAARAAPHEHHDMTMQQASTTQSGTGVLKGVNATTGKVQIAHEPIAALDWPAMTMWFMLKTPLPQDIKVGDSVRFEMKENENKQWEIVKIGRR